MSRGHQFDHVAFLRRPPVKVLERETLNLGSQSEEGLGGSDRCKEGLFSACCRAWKTLVADVGEPGSYIIGS